MLKRYFRFFSAVLLLLVAMPSVSRAQFGGSSIVFDPQMFARQLSQLEQETAAVTNLAQQLQYMVKNTTGGGADIWQSNQNLLANVADSFPNSRDFPTPSWAHPTIPAALSRLQRDHHARRAKPSGERRYDAQHPKRRAPECAVAGQNFLGEQAALETLETKNQTALGNLQAIQTGNEIALAQVQQIQMLRQLVMAMMNSRRTLPPPTSSIARRKASWRR